MKDISIKMQKRAKQPNTHLRRRQRGRQPVVGPSEGPQNKKISLQERMSPAKERKGGWIGDRRGEEKRLTCSNSKC